MALLGKEYQRRWKKKQKAKNKKPVSVVLSGATYDRLKKIKEHTRQNFSDIIDKSVMNLPVPDGFQMGNGHLEEKMAQSLIFSNELIEVFGPDLTKACVSIGDKGDSRFYSGAIYRGSEKKLQFILNNCRDNVFWADAKTDKFKYLSPSAATVLGYTGEELKTFRPSDMLLRIVHPDDRKRLGKFTYPIKPADPGEIGITVEYRVKNIKKGYLWVSTSITLLYDEKNEPSAVVGITRDVHSQKLAELALQKLHDDLEKRIRERTASLEEANTALALMLKKEQELKTEIEDKILANLKELVLPYIEKLKKTRLDSRQKKFLGMMELNLTKIVSPFLRKLSSKFLSLTPAEIQVADLIRHGKSTKDISELLDLSVRTIECHRAHVREKIGIKNKRTSLRSQLMSFE